MESKIQNFKLKCNRLFLLSLFLLQRKLRSVFVTLWNKRSIVVTFCWIGEYIALEWSTSSRLASTECLPFAASTGPTIGSADKGATFLDGCRQSVHPTQWDAPDCFNFGVPSSGMTRKNSAVAPWIQKSIKTGFWSSDSSKAGRSQKLLPKARLTTKAVAELAIWK